MTPYLPQNTTQSVSILENSFHRRNEHVANFSVLSVKDIRRRDATRAAHRTGHRRPHFPLPGRAAGLPPAVLAAAASAPASGSHRIHHRRHPPHSILGSPRRSAQVTHEGGEGGRPLLFYSVGN